MPLLEVEFGAAATGEYLDKSWVLQDARLPGSCAVMGYLGPLPCPRMKLIPQTKSLLPPRVKALDSIQEKAPKYKGERQLLKLASATELCDLGLATQPL